MYGLKRSAHPQHPLPLFQFFSRKTCIQNMGVDIIYKIGGAIVRDLS